MSSIAEPESPDWRQHTHRIVGLFTLAHASNGHCVIVSNPDHPMHYVQAMVFPDGMVNIEISEAMTSRFSYEALEADGWHVPDGRFGSEDFANPSRAFEANRIEQAAEVFCTMVNEIDRTGARWWAIQVFERSAANPVDGP